ncbi:helix-turn-helix domain-containing protein [Peribacillus glennii]|uniref:Helix-turn-helix domain-containing protein n=1 Tax=Peribacillus glennii TaxID=2303991 RepID=A0A372L8J3_9BACI|nr:helix-turn-helix domain-containing protein [Peribacillus glennii]RFU61215.1 helix-turn-helix domain-containing protein [Peribacillus glennii]
MKKHIDVIASVDSYHNLSTFTDIEEMNKTVRTYKNSIKSAVKRVDVQARLITLVELLKRHSCKQIGVSYMCKNTIASKLEISYKTVQRLVKKLEELGMIRQVAMKRKKDMLQTANAILIIPVEDNLSDKTPTKKSGKCPTIKTTNISLKQNINNKRKTVSQSSIVDKPGHNYFQQSNFVAHWVPDRFTDMVGSFYTKAEIIQEFWKVVKQCNRVVNYTSEERAFTADQELQIGIRAFKEFVMKVKKETTMKKGIFAYFNGIVNNLMDKLYFDEDFMQE